MRLMRGAREVKNGAFKGFIVTAERGMGKSSLASYLKTAVEARENLLAVHTFIGGFQVVEEVTTKFYTALLNECQDKTWWERAREFFGDTIQSVGVLGVNFSFNPPHDKLRHLTINFYQSLKGLYDKVKDDKKGILLIIDDVDGLGLSAGLTLPHFLKNLIDEGGVDAKPVPLMLILVVIPAIRDAMFDLQPSIRRGLEPIHVRPMSNKEARSFFENAFKQAGFTVTPEAVELMSYRSGGFPALLHEIGDAVYWADQDWVVDGDDARAGIKIATDIVGRKYIEPKVLSVMQEPIYAPIMAAIAEPPDLGLKFSAGSIRKRLPPTNYSTLRQFLDALQKSHVLSPTLVDEEYEFTSELYYLYLQMARPAA